MHVTVIDANDNPPIISVNGSDTVEEVTRSVEEQQDPGVLVFVIDVSLLIKVYCNGVYFTHS